MPILQGIYEFHSIILILETDTIDITSAPMKNTLLNIKYWTKLPKRKKTRRKPLFAGFGLKHAKENQQHLLKNIVLSKGFRGSFNPATSISLWQYWLRLQKVVSLEWEFLNYRVQYIYSNDCHRTAKGRNLQPWQSTQTCPTCLNFKHFRSLVNSSTPWGEIYDVFACMRIFNTCLTKKGNIDAFVKY